MSLTLTDADRAVIERIWSEHEYGKVWKGSLWCEAIYLAGMRAGIEKAAQVCDALESQNGDYSRKTFNVPADCAKAIRDLLDAPEAKG